MREMPYKVPTEYNGMRIKFRVPYTMPGEMDVVIGGNGVEYPEATFLHSTELPFEVWDMNVDAAQLDANSIPIAAPAPGIHFFWRVRVQDVSKNQLITKNAQLVQTLIDNADGIWYWRVPYTIVRAEGFQVAVDNLLPANILRAAITFRGFLLVLKPPSETR